MHCDRARAWMDRSVVEGLAAAERELSEVHLRDCPDCQQRLHGLQRLLATLGSTASPPVPEGVVGRVMAFSGAGPWVAELAIHREWPGG